MQLVTDKGVFLFMAFVYMLHTAVTSASVHPDCSVVHRAFGISAVLHRNKPSSQDVTNLGHKQLQGFFYLKNALTLWSWYFNAIRQTAQMCSIAFEKSGAANQWCVWIWCL